MSCVSNLCRLHKLAVAKMNGSSHLLLYDNELPDELPDEQLLADVHRLHHGTSTKPAGG